MFYFIIILKRLVSIMRRVYACLFSTILLFANNSFFALWDSTENFYPCEQTDYFSTNMENSQGGMPIPSFDYYNRQAFHLVNENNGDHSTFENQIPKYTNHTTLVDGEIGEGCDCFEWTCKALGEENYKGLDDELTDCHCEKGVKQELYDAAENLCCAGDCRNCPAAVGGFCTGFAFCYLIKDQLEVGKDIDPKAIAALQDSCECCCTVGGTFKNVLGDMVGDMCTIM